MSPISHIFRLYQLSTNVSKKHYEILALLCLDTIAYVTNFWWENSLLKQGSIIKRDVGPLTIALKSLIGAKIVQFNVTYLNESETK